MKDDERSDIGKVALYRYTQLASNLLNEVQQRFLVSSILAVCIITFGVSLAILMNTPATMNLPVLIITGIVSTDAIVLKIFGCRPLRKYMRSLQKINRSLFQLRGTKDRKWVQRFMKSCGVLKV